MNFLDNALNLIFPPVCGICGKIGKKYLCDKCKMNLTNSDIYLNQLQDYSNDKSNFIDEHFYLFSYTGIIREKILQYKFEDKTYLSNTISEFFMNNEKLYRFFKKYDIMEPIPISIARKKERGYNQSELIARKIKKLGIINLEKQILVKETDNRPQNGLNRKDRSQNVKNVYKVQNEQKIKDKRILLLDDVYTTGATANECAKILKQAGAKKVGILTIAKDFKKINI